MESPFAFVSTSRRKKSRIFEGVIAYIDGETKVPYNTLRQMMCDHGGRFEPVSFGVKLTHFVAENVSYAKYKDLLYMERKMMHSQKKHDIYVVTPDWIVESVNAGKRMSESSFSLFAESRGLSGACKSSA